MQNVISVVPSPLESQKYKVKKIYEGPSDDDISASIA